MRCAAIVLASAFVGLLLLDTPAHAQSNATLQGTVTDSQSAVMPGVTLTIRNEATGAERTTTSDAAGQYVAAALPPGRYSVMARIEGFTDQTREVDLGVAQTTVIDFRLNIGRNRRIGHRAGNHGFRFGRGFGFRRFIDRWFDGRLIGRANLVFRRARTGCGFQASCRSRWTRIANRWHRWPPWHRR